MRISFPLSYCACSKKHELITSFWPLDLDKITGPDIQKILAESAIQWKVIVISACYSGGFIESLKDDKTLVITAADATNASFGCSNDSEFTYFGKAYFDEALRKSYSFVEPFESV